MHYAAWRDNSTATTDLLLALPLLLPCRACRDSSAAFLQQMPPQPSAFHATIALHTAVNDKLGIRDPFEDMAEVLSSRFASGAVVLPQATVLAALAMTHTDPADPRVDAAFRLAASALRRALDMPQLAAVETGGRAALVGLDGAQ